MPLEILKRRTFSTKTEVVTKAFLAECAWEVCNQLGGIYTVIRSKVPEMSHQWGDQYCLVGPLVGQQVNAEIDPINSTSGPIGKAVKKLREDGIDVIYGNWLISGRPKVVLIDVLGSMKNIELIRKEYKEEHELNIANDELQEKVLVFSYLTSRFYKYLSSALGKTKLIGHFHEWMSSIPILDIKKNELPIKTVFTTHATALGRYLAMNDQNFYNKLDQFDWEIEAKRYNILPIAHIERICAQAADIVTTVSDVTASECLAFYNRVPDVITPNGLNIERFVAYHEVQNLHQENKDAINEFVIGHFFHHTPFDLDNTLYFFTSGRYEFKNKGYDLTLEALNLLNRRLKKEKSNKNVVMFFITKRPTWSINPVVLEQQGVLEEFRKVCKEIQAQLGDRLFHKGAAEEEDFRLPNLSDFVDDYWKLRYRRVLQSWKSDQWPIVVTHNLKNDDDDEIIQYLRKAPLLNNPLDKVKIVYHPDFIDSSNPLFGLDYNEFIRGCHLGIFPSYYEPWGYTPLECLAQGVSAITSDLTGFGNYLGQNFPGHEQSGVYLLKRHKLKPDLIVKELAELMYQFTMSSRRQRISIRNKSEDLAENFDWSKLCVHYNQAYQLALAK
jgi:glycogen(starch) synthase